VCGFLTDERGQVEPDGSAPDWAKGYSVEDLKRVTTLFERHDEGLVYGTFDRYSGHDAVNDLSNGWLTLGPRDDAGVPVWACVVRELDRKQPVSDFTGGRMTLSPGILYCTRMAFSDEIAAISILDQLCAYSGPVAVECWQEHHGERALVSRLRAIDATGQPGDERGVGGGMRLAAVKIKASSSMRGLWVSQDIEDPPWGRRAGERYTLYPKQELLGLAQLPLALPQDAILALSCHPTVCDESAYAAHYSSYGKDDTWTALALRGFYAEPERIEKPSKMSRRWKSEHQKDLDREPRDTPLRATLGPAAEKILAALPCAGFERIRLMRLAPGGEISRHSDITDPDTGASEGKMVRVHIPLISNERCLFRSWGLDGNTSSMVMRPGTAAYLDVRKPHTAVNMGDTPRIHLVVDCYANTATVEMLLNARPAPLDGSPG
jgi:Aspartyl/Asparaginyl beta-hydroxylase